MSNSTLLILPTYNECQNITSILQAVTQVRDAHKLNLEVLVIDDSSPDGTARLVAEFAKSSPWVKLLTRSGKQGLASAYQFGFQYAIDHHYDAVIQMDSDFSHNPEVLAEHAKWIEEFDVVIGARYIPGGSVTNWNWWRRLLSYGGNLYTRLVLSTPLHDFTGGYNAYRTTALQKLNFSQVNSHGYAFQIEMKVRAYRCGLRLKEIPIKFIDRKYGKSKIPRSTYFEALIKVMLWRLRSFD